MTAIFDLVTDRDREALMDFMLAYAPIMMFPLSNLTRYGLGGDNSRAITAWMKKDGDKITDVVTISQEGMVFPCCPSGDWTAAAAPLLGRMIKGFVGDNLQVASLRKAMGMTQRAPLDETEPAFLVDLDDIQMPDTKGCTLHPLNDAPHDLMVTWRAHYEIETLAVPETEAHLRAEHQIRSFKAIDSHRVLMQNETPVAMTGLNATLPKIVQIGGVYTPPDYRAQGFARIALALHLAEIAANGVTQAVLSAANTYAAKAYMALGFRRIGDFGLVVYETSQVAHG